MSDDFLTFIFTRMRVFILLSCLLLSSLSTYPHSCLFFVFIVTATVRGRSHFRLVRTRQNQRGQVERFLQRLFREQPTRRAYLRPQNQQGARMCVCVYGSV